MSLADRIRQAREAAGLNQSDLARRLGVKPQSVNQWERGKTRPGMRRLEKIASVLGVSAAELVGEDSAAASGQRSDEVALIHAYRRLPADRKSTALRVLRALEPA